MHLILNQEETFGVGIASFESVFPAKEQDIDTDQPRKSNIVPEKSPLPHLIENFYLHDLKTLLKSLEDPIQHGKLVSQIRALIALQTQKKQEDINYFHEAWQFLLKEINTTGSDIFHLIEFASEFASTQRWLKMEARKDPWHKWGQPLVFILISVVIGLFVGWGAKTILSSPKKFLSSIKIQRKFIFLIERIFQIIFWTIPYVCFSIATYTCASFFSINTRMDSLLIDLLIGGFIIKISHMCIKAILSPKDSHRRMIALSDNFAKRIYSWLIKVTGWGLWLYFIILSMQELGLPKQVSNLFNQILGLIVTIQIIYFILQNRLLFRRFLERIFIPDTSYPEKTHHEFIHIFSQIWHIPLIIGVCSFYLAIFFQIGEFRSLMTHIGISLGVFFLARLCVNALEKYQKTYFNQLFSKHWPRLHSKLYHKLHIIENICVFLIYVFAVYLQFLFWNINLINLFLDDHNNLYPFISGILRTLFVGFISYIIWVSFDIFIEKYLEKEDQKRRKTGKSMSGRIRTLIPILHKILFFFLGSVTIFVFLSGIGVDTAPMLGGLALVSVAVSLGAQNLIRDIFSGFFIILEDAVAVNDIVDIDGKKGKVETVTIRAIRLRDDYGSLHTIPFGAVKILTNMTRDYAYAFILLTVDYDYDTDYIIQVIKETVGEMMKDEKYGPLILEPVDIKGIDKFNDSGVEIHGLIKTKPGEQFKIRREFNRYIKKKFQSLGIIMPTPQHTIYLHHQPEGAPKK